MASPLLSNFIDMQRTHCILFFILVLIFKTAVAQVPQKNFGPHSFNESEWLTLKKKIGNKKDYPPEFEQQILIALSFYPELKNTRITFRKRPRHGTAITRSAWGSVLLPPGKRSYVITISDTAEAALVPLLLKNLSFNVQVAVLGHELAHIVQYERMTTAGLLKYAVCNISALYIDRFEYSADAICIAHGLGYQLFDWSDYVRKKMNTVYWLGPDYLHRKKTRERYMNPSTILQRIDRDSLYNQLR
jgi:hypothetical protein